MKVGILGASGVVGQEMLKVLREKDFPIDELRLFSGPSSSGKRTVFSGKEYIYTQANEDSFTGLDIVLGAAENDVARYYAPFIKKAGALFIDNSSSFRLDDDVPLVIPEINGDDAFRHNGIIANPNCVTIIALMALYPISRISPITTVTASTYQAVSGAGKAGLAELEQQIRDFSAGEELKVSAFSHQIAFNLIPKIGDVCENGYTKEEMKLLNEGRKIMHLPKMNVSCTCVRVPVFRSHSISLSIQTEKPVSVDEARKAIAAAPGCKLLDCTEENIFPTPLVASDVDTVFVGRIREDLAHGGLNLWCCGDQIRKGAATNAVQIAQLFL